MSQNIPSIGYPGRYHYKFILIIVVISLFGLVIHVNRPLPIQPAVYLRPSQHTNTNDCKCLHKDVNYIIKLHHPWHHFDSNHWFHICEYYLSRHRLVDSYVPDNSSVIIVSDDPGFTVGVTEMTLFFMMLSFTQGNPKEVIVYDPPHHMRSVTHGVNTSRKFVYNGPQYHYQRDAPLEKRYTLYHSLNQYISLNETIKPSLCTCGEYVGEFGSAPIDRGYWFSGPQDVNLFRSKLASLCPSHESPILLADHRDIVVPFHLPSTESNQINDSTATSSSTTIQENSTSILDEKKDFNGSIEDTSPRIGVNNTNRGHPHHHPIRNHHRLNHTTPWRNETHGRGPSHTFSPLSLLALLAILTPL